MSNGKRVLSLLLTVILGLGVMPMHAYADTSQPFPSENKNRHSYTPYANMINSYLYEENGNFMRVENVKGKIVVENYNNEFKLQSQRMIEHELPIWGGFFAGKDYNFFVFGQANFQEDDNVEVLRVVKYNKRWKRIDSLSLYGLNTIDPFASGSLRCAEDKDNLYIHTCHKMYKTPDGRNHQANLTLSIKKSNMSMEKISGLSPYTVTSGFHFYVSHSFDQFILVDQNGKIVTYDYGDAFPRSAVLTRNANQVEVQKFAGSSGQNVTNASLGGLTETSKGYVTAYHYQDGNVFLSYTPKDHFSEKDTKITQLCKSKDWNPFGQPTPMLVSAGLNGGYVMWYGATYERFDPPKPNGMIGQYSSTFYYTTYDSEGRIGEIKSVPAELSDCRPIVVNGKVIWYVTEDSVPVFYILDNGNLSKVVAS